MIQMGETDVIAELVLLLKVRYPLLFIITQEEQRAARLLGSACDTLQIPLSFLRRPGGKPDLDMLSRYSESADAVLLLDHVHRRLFEPDVVRAISDAVVSNRRLTLAIIAPYADVPLELERKSGIFRLPFPCTSEISRLLDKVCLELGVSVAETERDLFVRAAIGMTADEALRSFKKALIGWRAEPESSLLSVMADKKMALRKSRVLEAVDAPPEMSQIGGLDQLKSWVTSRRAAFTAEAEVFGLPPPKGVLLMGVQGCGKSLSAKAVASCWRLPLVRLDISALFGEDRPEQSLVASFQVLEAMSPLVLWIDELEKGFESGRGGDASRVLGGLVTWLQEKRCAVFVVATANRVASLPPELLRKGRMDEIFFVDLPDRDERHDIFSIHLRGRGRNPARYDLKALVDLTERYSGSEIEQVVVSGLYHAFSRKDELTDADLRAAARQTVPLYDTFEEEIKNLREWARRRARPATTDRRKSVHFQ